MHGALVSALVLWAAVAGLAVLGPSRDLLVQGLVAYTAAFLALLHLWRSHREFLDDPRILLGGALLLRLTLFPALPDLSDDLYRYVWDGWLLFQGISPYRWIPADPALAHLHDSVLFREMNSPGYYSIYPPFSQLAFFPAGIVHTWVGWPGSAYAIKGTFLLLEGGGVVLMYRALRLLGHAPGALALYAWNPLVLVTVAGTGHTEGGLALGLGLVALGVAGAGARIGWLGLVAATLSKGIPLLLAPLFLRLQHRGHGIRKMLRAALPAAVVGILLTAPFLSRDLPAALLASADLYVRLFEFNAGLYFVLKEALFRATGEDWGNVLGPALRWGFLLAALGVWLRWPLRSTGDWFRGSLLLFSLYLVTATTVHPWYVTWGLLLLPFTPFLRAAWLWASWAAFPTYLTYVGVSHQALTAAFWSGVAFFTIREALPGLKEFALRMAGARKARQLKRQLRGTRLLDLGAGEGYLAARLDGVKEGTRKVFLADLGPYFRVPLGGIVYDGHHLPLRDRSVDTVVLSLVLHHCEDPASVLRESLRVARKRVLVTESTFRHTWERRILEVLDRTANRGRAEGGMDTAGAPLRFRTVKEWEEMIEAVGGRIVTSRRLNRIGHRHHLFVVEPFQREPSARLGRASGAPETA